MKKKLLLEVYDFLGDNVMLTSIIKNLSEQYNDKYEIGVLTEKFKDVYKNNPNVNFDINLKNNDIFIKRFGYFNKHDFYADYGHSIFGFKRHIEEKLGIEIFIKDMNCDIHLYNDEKENRFGNYWVLNAGFMNNILVKHYPHEKFEQVVKLLEGKIKFVQVGTGMYHIPIDGCINMVNKTSLRQLFNIIYNSRGTLSPISSTIHLSTMQSPYGKPRPSVVIAGGRENNQLFIYNNTFPISNVGFYDCCKINGCLKRNDCNHKVFLNNGLWSPKCMCDISPERIAETILYCDKYYR